MTLSMVQAVQGDKPGFDGDDRTHGSSRGQPHAASGHLSLASLGSR